MKTGTTLSGVGLLCAFTVATGAITLIGRAHTPIDLRSSSEAAVLLLSGMGCVLLADQIRQTEKMLRHAVSGSPSRRSTSSNGCRQTWWGT